MHHASLIISYLGRVAQGSSVAQHESTLSTVWPSYGTLLFPSTTVTYSHIFQTVAIFCRCISLQKV